MRYIYIYNLFFLTALTSQNSLTAVRAEEQSCQFLKGDKDVPLQHGVWLQLTNFNNVLNKILTIAFQRKGLAVTSVLVHTWG